MSLYRSSLPQMSDRHFMTDGGLETTLVFHDGIELPHFAAFDLLRDRAGREHLRGYYRRYLDLARQHRLGFVLEAPTWRANPDWAGRIGYDYVALAQANRDAIALMSELRAEFDDPQSPVVISGNIGPRGDGYRPDLQMGPAVAEDYHSPQIAVFADSDADLVSAFTLNTIGEAIGIVNAARAHRMPVVISFTVETDGRLPTGDSLGDAIQRTDEATDGYCAYYMINCAHPRHFEGALADGAPWLQRLRGVRANASMRSHAELDDSTELDVGDPEQLGRDHARLTARMPWLAVFGGCCGTDHRHVDAICRSVGMRAA